MAKTVITPAAPPSPTPSIKDKIAEKANAAQAQVNPQQALNQETLSQEVIKQKGKKG